MRNLLTSILNVSMAYCIGTAIAPTINAMSGASADLTLSVKPQVGKLVEKLADKAKTQG